jgi:SAM-dependent methyltransferase
VTQPAPTFAGSIPETYHAHLGPLFFEPYAADLAARLAPLAGPRAAVLEVAAGSGILTRHLRAALPPDATLTATDISPPMLELARAHLGDTRGIDWQPADAAALPFADGAFDAVVCQFGLMFVADKPRAAREAFRVLRPGGQFLLNVWCSLAENPIARITNETVTRFYPADPPGFLAVPFGFHDPAALRALLADAGFADVRVTTVELPAEAPTAEHAATGLVSGSPLLSEIQQRGGADPDEVVRATAAALSSAHGDRPLRAPMKALVAAARRPA